MGIFKVFSDFVTGLGNLFINAFSFVSGFFSDIFWRFIGLPGFILDLFGIRPTKKLRIKFIILRDENGVELIPQANIEETFKLTKRIFDEQADIELIQTGKLIAGSAPEGALNVTSPTKSFLKLWYSEIGKYFNALAGIGLFTRRLSVIIVNTLEGHIGRSFGPMANFVLVEKALFQDPKKPKTTVAHEICHACGLFLHRKPKENLMYHTYVGRGEILYRWQSSVVRSARFVWYH
jgi:hypothetical protein